MYWFNKSWKTNTNINMPLCYLTKDLDSYVCYKVKQDKEIPHMVINLRSQCVYFSAGYSFGIF